MIFDKHINRYYIKYAGWLLVGLLTLFVIDLMQLKIPNLYQMVINGINTGFVSVDGVPMAFTMHFLVKYVCVPMICIIACMVFGRFLWRVAFFGASIRIGTELRNKMFHHAKDLSQEYYQVNKVGNLMSLFTNDLDTIEECVGWGFLMFFDATFLGTLAVIKMWQMDAGLTMLSMIPMFFLMGASLVLGKWMTKKWDVRQAAFSKLSDFSQESFSGIAVIKAFVKEAKELLAFEKLNVENEKANVEYTRASVLLRILVTLFIESVICVILGYGGYLVYKGNFNAGQLVEFIGYFDAVIWPIMAVAELIDMVSRGKASLKRVGELLDATQDVKDREKVEHLETIKGDIAFRDLTFRYPNGEYDVLKNISFTIHAGENVGLVGRTGSGKSTLVDLILRTYNVPDGTLFIDGKDVNAIALKDVRAACAYVPQDNFLFSDTIENNIAFGVKSKTDDFGLEKNLYKEVRKAAHLADIHTNIQEFQEGYQTVLGERGVTVSGGQKQRISIARALMKDAPILILDDSVSAVDTKTERTIMQNLKETRA